MDKFRERLLNEKLKEDYDVIMKLHLNKLYKTESKSFKNLISKKLNAAFRFGVHSTLTPSIKTKEKAITKRE